MAKTTTRRKSRGCASLPETGSSVHMQPPRGGCNECAGPVRTYKPPRGVSVLALQPKVAAARLNERGPRVMARGPRLLGSLCRPRPACRRRQLWPKCLVGQRLRLSPGIQEGCQGFPVGFPCWIPMSAGSGRVRCSCGGSACEDHRLRRPGPLVIPGDRWPAKQVRRRCSVAHNVKAFRETQRSQPF